MFVRFPTHTQIVARVTELETSLGSGLPKIRLDDALTLEDGWDRIAFLEAYEVEEKPAVVVATPVAPAVITPPIATPTPVKPVPVFRKALHGVERSVAAMAGRTTAFKPPELFGIARAAAANAKLQEGK
jgi:hypothetical protein